MLQWSYLIFSVMITLNINILLRTSSQFKDPLFIGRFDLTKNPNKGGIEKLLKGRGNPKEGFCRKEGCCQSVYFSSWGVANVTTVIFNYILVIVLRFPLIAGVSPCFHCTALVPVYRMYTSYFHNAVVRSCYRPHTSVCLMQVLRLVSV